MSYIAGTSGLAHLGIPDGGPRVRCDHASGCEQVFTLKPGRVPPVWFLDGRPPPGWTGARGSGWRLDYCAAHKPEPAPVRSKGWTP